MPRVKIIRFEESVFYANVDNFKYKILKIVDINPFELKRKLNEKLRKKMSELRERKEERFKICKQLEEESVDELKSSFHIKYIIIDCSCINYIDSQGVAAILQLYEAYKYFSIEFYLVYCKRKLSFLFFVFFVLLYSSLFILFPKYIANVIKSFRKYIQEDKLDFNHLYKTINDALKHITNEIKRARNFQSGSEMEKRKHSRLFVVENESRVANDVRGEIANNKNNATTAEMNETGHVNLAMDYDDSNSDDDDDDDDINDSRLGKGKKTSEIYETLEELNIGKNQAPLNDLSSVIDF